MDELQKLRKEIDRVDKVLITALGERMRFMSPIGKLKKEHNIPVYQEKRDEDIMNALKTVGKDLQLNDEFIEEVFLSVFNEAKRLQQKEFDDQ